MILVDTRSGSEPYILPLRKLGLEVEGVRLEYGDVSFEGKGTASAPVQIGVELKSVGDAIGSLRSGRLTGNRQQGEPGQLPGMLESYDYSYLLVEGQWRADENGYMCHYCGPRLRWQRCKGSMPASEFDKRLLGIQECLGVRVVQTNRQADTVRWLANLYHWWRDTALDAHTSHLAPHAPQGLFRISPFRQAIMAWPGVGRKVSLAAEEAFKTVECAATISPELWADLKTTDDLGRERRFGEAAARKVYTFLRGGTA